VGNLLFLYCALGLISHRYGGDRFRPFKANFSLTQKYALDLVHLHILDDAWCFLLLLGYLVLAFVCATSYKKKLFVALKQVIGIYPLLVSLKKQAMRIDLFTDCWWKLVLHFRGTILWFTLNYQGPSHAHWTGPVSLERGCFRIQLFFFHLHDGILLSKD